MVVAERDHLSSAFKSAEVFDESSFCLLDKWAFGTFDSEKLKILSKTC